MKKNSSLFAKLEQNEFSQIHQCFGGQDVATGAAADPKAGTSCTKDIVNRFDTAIPGDTGGATMVDEDNFRNNCLTFNNNYVQTTVPTSTLVR
jgi:hypothetical protein